MPYAGQCGISRKIEDKAERKRLKRIIGNLSLREGMGVIIRTVGQNKPERFFVYSGFIFTNKDTLLGSISMTYDLDNIIFTPNIKVDKLIELNNVGKSRMTLLISEIKKE